MTEYIGNVRYFQSLNACHVIFILNVILREYFIEENGPKDIC